jgi:hypothetical protein
MPRIQLTRFDRSVASDAPNAPRHEPLLVLIVARSNFPGVPVHVAAQLLERLQVRTLRSAEPAAVEMAERIR